MSCNIDALPDLDCPLFDEAFVQWLNTLKNNVVASDTALCNIDIPTAQPPFSLLANPVLVFGQVQTKVSGDFDTGSVSVNLNSIAGVAVPAGASGVIVRAAAGVNGNQDRIGESNSATLGFVHMEVASTNAGINGGNMTSAGQVRSLVVYTDTNIGGGDNDDTNDVIVPLNGNNISYRGKVRWSGNNTGVDTGVLRLYVVGFTL